MQEVRQLLDGGAKAVSNFSNKIGVMSSLGTTLSIGVTAPIVAMSATVIRAALNMDQLKKGLETVEGSTTKAEAALQKLEIAARAPGLGFKEAIKGFTSLRAAGLDADLAQRSLSAFGNALATVGKGKAELDGVSLALQQIATKSKFSAEEVNQLAERVPQIRKAMQAAFGTADTEVIQKMGISNIEIIKRIVIELEKLSKAADGPKNALDNLTETLEKSADRIGKKMLPAITELIPKVEKLVTGLADVLDGFTSLPDSIQTGAIALVGLAIASGPLMKVVTGLRSIKDEILAIRAIGAASALAGAAGSAIDPFLRLSQRAIPGVAGAVGSAATTFSAAGAGIAAGGGLAVGAALYGLNNSTTALEQQKKASDEAAAGMKRLNDRFYEAKQPTSDAYEALVKHTQALADIPPKLKPAGDGIAKINNAIKVDSVAETKYEKLARLFESGKISAREYDKQIALLNVEMENGKRVGTQLSETSLVYVEQLQRVKAATEKAKDVMYEYSVQGTAMGTTMELWKAPMAEATLDFESMSGAIRTATEGMKMLSTLRPPQIDITNDNLRRGSVFEADDILGSASTRNQAQRVAKAEADLARIKQLNAEGKATGNDVITAQQNLKKAMEDVGGASVKTAHQASAAWKQVSTIATDLSRGIANAGVGLLFSRGAQVDVQKYKDEITALEAEQQKLLLSQSKGNDVTKLLAANSAKLADVNKRMAEETRKASFAFRALEAGKSIIEDLAKSITRVLIEGALKKLTDKLFDVNGLMGKVFGGATSVGGSVFSAASSAGGGAASAASSASGGIGGAANAVGSSLAGVVGAVGSVVSAVSGVIGNFQMAHMNTALGRIEENTRYTKIWTGEQSQSLLWCAQKSTEYLGYAVKSLDTIGLLQSQMLGLAQAGGAGGTTINMAGAYLLTDAALDDFIERFSRRLKTQGL